MTPKMAPSILHAKTAAFLLFTVVLSATLAFGQSPVSRLAVQVRPEMLLTPAASSVQLTVRLAPSVQAQVWRADTCAAAPADGFVVTQSGRIQIPVASLATAARFAQCPATAR